MKYMGRRFSEMDSIQFSAATSGLMAKITAITGWRIPGVEGVKDYEKIFIDQLKKYVLEHAADLTLSELEYALRKYGLNMSDWGRPMHLGLLSSCINSYKSYRINISEIEEQYAAMPVKSIEGTLKSIELSNSTDWTSEWNNVLNGARIGQIKNVWITTDLYEWLLKQQIIEEPTRQEKWDTIRECAKIYLAELEDSLVSGVLIHPPHELRRRIALLKNPKAPIWKKDTSIMSSLTVMVKKEFVRQAAILHILNEEV